MEFGFGLVFEHYAVPSVGSDFAYFAPSGREGFRGDGFLALFGPLLRPLHHSPIHLIPPLFALCTPYTHIDYGRTERFLNSI